VGPNAYAGIADVEALNRAREIGKGNNPTASDVAFYLEISAAEINGIILQKGYQLPIPSNATGALQMLRGINAKGAWYQMEEASPSSQNKENAEKAYQASLEMLRTAELLMSVPKETERTRPRGPGLNVPRAGNLESDPFFHRRMYFFYEEVSWEDVKRW
jgi:hypothetical protein